jgi:hypothetical protein
MKKLGDNYSGLILRIPVVLLRNKGFEISVLSTIPSFEEFYTES